MKTMSERLSRGGNMVCPPWMCFTFDNIFRRLIHNPERMLSPYVDEGNTVLDIGPGKGFFTIPLAGLVGPEGTVIAADLQQPMLDAIMKRARRANLADRVALHLTGSDTLGVDRNIDFALAFWMVHEVPDQAKFFTEIHSLLKPDGRFLMVEPGIHVTEEAFEASVKTAVDCGLTLIDRPKIRISRAALFGGSGPGSV